MHILLLHQYFLDSEDSGGSRFNEMTRTWREEGHQVTVLAGMVHYTTGVKKDHFKGKSIYTETNKDGVKIIRSHVSEAYNTNFVGRLWAYFSFVFSSIYSGIFKAREKYDIILVTSPPLFVGITGLVLSAFKRIPLVFEIRDLWPESAIDTGVLTNKFIIRLAYWFEALIYKKARLINCLTPAFQVKLIENKGVPAAKTVMIPNAADFSLSEELLKTFDAAQLRTQKNWDGKFVVTYVGAHGIANHLSQVLETAGLLKDTNAHFVLIGEGMEKPKLKELAQKMNLSNIEFIDAVPKAEVFKYILASDMGASVLKKVDTFKTVYSNKTFDYMSCRKPIMMAIDGVSRALVEEAKCGVYVEPENPADFASKVRDYMANPGKVIEQGTNGYDFAKINFDRKYLALKYLEELKKIV